MAPLACTLRNRALFRLAGISAQSARAFSTSFVSRKDTSGLKKLFDSAEQAVSDIPSGSTILSGGFGLCGTADTLIQALAKRSEVQNLTCVSNNAGVGQYGLGILLQNGQIGKMIASFIGSNKHLEKLYLTGKISLELCPQGTIAERCRAAGAGIPAFYTPSGVGTLMETGGITEKYKEGENSVEEKPGRKRETRVFNGKKYMMEEAIRGDYAFVRAWKADEYGNCQFRYAQQNFSGAMARSAKVTIVEAEEIVKVGDLDPNFVHLPGVYVNRIVKATEPKRIEFETLSDKSGDDAALGKGSAKARRERIVRRAAKELKDGMYVNLGIGMPMLAPNFIEPGTTIHMQSENGILGMGPYPTKETIDADIINAGKETVTLLPGACTFDSAESFAMIRGGHIDVAMLGAMEVSANGDLANYMIPGKMVKGPGGAMDLVANPEETKVIIVTDHTDKNGKSKIVQECSLPLTGVRCVSQIITDLCVFEVDRKNGGLTVTELAPGVTLEELKQKTAAEFKTVDNLGEMQA